MELLIGQSQKKAGMQIILQDLRVGISTAGHYDKRISCAGYMLEVFHYKYWIFHTFALFSPFYIQILIIQGI